MKKFFPWLVPILILLIAIPVLINFDLVLIAKLIGGIVIIVTSIALRVWLKNANKVKTLNPTIKFNVNDRYFLSEHFLDYRKASSKVKKEIEREMGRFIANTVFDSSSKDELRKEDCLTFAYYCTAFIDGLKLNYTKNSVVVFISEENGRVEKSDQYTYLLIDPTLILNTIKDKSTATEVLNHNTIKLFLKGEA